MSFPRYPKYKPSGVEWLGDVPEHWDIRRIRTLFEIKKRIAGKLGFDVFSVTQNGIRIKDIESNEGQLSLDYSQYQLVEVGDFAMNPMDLLTGGADIAVTRGVTSPDYRVFSLRSPEASHDRYFLRLFQMMYRQQIFFHLGQGSSQLGRWRLPRDEFNNFPFPLPPLPEQSAIAAFLDLETAKIDGLVAEQRRLIELLKEKRQAVISHAVTKGLNPTAPMKPSGIDWLGDVPGHWKVGKAGFYIRVLSGFAFPSAGFSDNQEDVRLLRGINVGVGRTKWDETVRWKRVPNDDLETYELAAGDLVIGMDRPWISEGVRVARITKSDLPCLLLQRVASLKTGPKLSASYFMHLLALEDVFNAHFAPDTTGVSVPHISPEQIRDYVIPVPPIEEQDEIVEQIRSESTKLDSLTVVAERAIELLQERRTALISAAVTGKIDVPGLASTEAA